VLVSALLMVNLFFLSTSARQRLPITPHDAGCFAGERDGGIAGDTDRNGVLGWIAAYFRSVVFCNASAAYCDDGAVLGTVWVTQRYGNPAADLGSGHNQCQGRLQGDYLVRYQFVQYGCGRRDWPADHRHQCKHVSDFRVERRRYCLATSITMGI